MKLIDKDALVAEIDALLDDEFQCDSYDEATGFQNALILVKKFINTLEVKEVDLEKAIDDYIYTNNGRKRMALELDWKQCDITFKAGKLIIFAKHFFELGMQAQFDKELVEEVYSHIDSIKDTADRMTSGNFMHNKAAIKFSADTIEKVLGLIGLNAQKGEKL